MYRVWTVTEDEFVERECLLFEAGEYPDKGVTVTERDLVEIARNSAAEIPVKVEHLSESPFDCALGVVTKLRAAGSQLWGTLRQPIEAWRLAQRAGARALSVGLDVSRKRLVETSFVCRPRVANAQVFGETALALSAEQGDSGSVLHFTQTLEQGEKRRMVAGLRSAAESFRESFRQFFTALDDGETEFSLDVEREALAKERAEFREERIGQTLMEWKRRGLIRASEKSENAARALLALDDSRVAWFGEKSQPVSAIFAQFVEANGGVVPMGEHMAGGSVSSEFSDGSSGARSEIIRLATLRAKTEGISLATAVAAVAMAHPELATTARD